MEHAGDAPFLHRCAQDLGRILLGVAGVDDKRQARLRGGVDMRLEPLALRFAVGLVVVIIEPAFADRDHPRVVGGLNQRGRAEIGMGVCFMGVNANTRPDVRVALGDRDDIVPLALARRDIEEAATPRSRAFSSTSS